jgi:hypothetical protein
MGEPDGWCCGRRNEPLQPQAMFRRLACSTGAIICFVAALSARAGSPVPQPPLDLGQTSFLDGEAGPGGLFEVISNGYVAVRNRPQGTSAVLRLQYPF